MIKKTDYTSKITHSQNAQINAFAMPTIDNVEHIANQRQRKRETKIAAVLVFVRRV